TLFPYTTLFRSEECAQAARVACGADQQAEQRGSGDVDQQDGDDAVTRPRKGEEEARENAHRPARDDERQLPPVDARTGRWGEAHASSKMGLSSATGSSIGTTSSGRSE